MTKSNLTVEIFPDPEKRALVITPVCGELEIHIWRLLLDHLASGVPLTLEETQMLGFQDKDNYTNKTFHLLNSKHKSQKVAVTGDTPGIITHDFPGNQRHIMRGIIGGTNRLKRTSMLESLIKRNIPEDKKEIIVPEIESTDELWFMNVFLTMLTQVGVNLSVQERTQLIANIEWFAQQY